MKKILSATIIVITSCCFMISCGSNKKDGKTGDNGTSQDTKTTGLDYSGQYKVTHKIIKTSEDFPDALLPDTESKEGNCIQKGDNFNCLDEDDLKDIESGKLKSDGKIDKNGVFKITLTSKGQVEGVSIEGIGVLEGKFTDKNQKAEGSHKGSVTLTKDGKSKKLTVEMTFTLERLGDVKK